MMPDKDRDYQIAAGVLPPTAMQYRAYLRSCGYRPWDLQHLGHKARGHPFSFILWLVRIDTEEKVLRCVGRDRRGHLFIRPPSPAELRLYRRAIIRRLVEGRSAA